MDNEEVKRLWEEFKKEYNFEEKKKIWRDKSAQFKLFWEQRILNEERKEIDVEEVNKIIRILDRKGKGNIKGSESVAHVMIAQGAWQRMFNEIKKDKELRETLFNVLNEKDDNKRISIINKLYEINQDRKNFLTGNNSNAIDAMLFAYNPMDFVSIVSLRHRKKVIEYFGFKGGPDFDNDSPGEKIINSNKIIIEGFKSLGIEFDSPRTITDFLYKNIKDRWVKGDTDIEIEEIEEEAEETPSEQIEQLEEKHYQKLIHRNFKVIFPDFEYYDKEYQDANEGHYHCEDGIMDFLCKDKDGNFVVIELKIGGSDKTVGQILRYMGWVKENLCEREKEVKGLIISENKDNKIDSALRVVPSISFKKMWLNVRIDNWK